MRILTNFLNSPERVVGPDGVEVQITRAEGWREFRRQLSAADLVVVDCRDLLIYRVAAYFALLPGRKRPLVAVDLVLRLPLRLRHRFTARIKRWLLGHVDHFIHYFRDISGYTQHFDIPPSRSSYVPFKVNICGRVLAASTSEDYIFTMGISLRDYDTFIHAVAQLPYPAAIPQFSFEHFEGRDRRFAWTAQNLPGNLKILPDSGSASDLLRNMARARIVVVPIQGHSLCASGISTYLDAMYLGKCVITTNGPGASDLLKDEALLVPPHDVAALRDAMRRAWEDEGLRRRTAACGHNYARSLGGEAELLQRVYDACFRALEFQGERSIA